MPDRGAAIPHRKTDSETSEIQKRRGFNGLVDICEPVEIQRNWLKLAGDPTYGVFDLHQPLRPLSEIPGMPQNPLTADGSAGIFGISGEVRVSGGCGHPVREGRARCLVNHDDHCKACIAGKAELARLPALHQPLQRTASAGTQTKPVMVTVPKN